MRHCVLRVSIEMDCKSTHTEFFFTIYMYRHAIDCAVYVTTTAATHTHTRTHRYHSFSTGQLSRIQTHTIHYYYCRCCFLHPSIHNEQHWILLLSLTHSDTLLPMFFFHRHRWVLSPIRSTNWKHTHMHSIDFNRTAI